MNHVESRSHKILVHTDPYYSQIDDLIDELNFKNSPSRKIDLSDALSDF